MIGKTLAHYEILSKLGEGGMGEVYRARDTKLDRDVALKILPADLAANAEYHQRFEREVRAIAALQHPNIVTIYSVEEAGEISFYTMELIDGQTLSQFTPPEGLPLDRIFDIAIPVADTFEIAGSFVNDKSMTQAFKPVLSAPPGIEPAWRTVADLAGALGKDLGFGDLDGLRKELSDTAEAAQ